jgi:chromosome segregation ATPase
MTKKRLADLLQEETQKSPDLETDIIQEPAPDQPSEPDPTVSEAEPLYETTEEPSPVKMSASPQAKRTSPTKAELETTVTELREALQAAKGKEDFLQQQITDLQSDLHEQKILVQKLQAELGQTNEIKAEFEQAKKVILQLSEASSKPTQEVNTRKKENKDFSSQKLALKKLPQHSIEPKLNSPSSKVSNADIGWFD